MKVLGIETSCDETAAAVVEDGHRLLSNTVASSIDLHTAYGGVVPEIAARNQLEVILPVIDQALAAAKTGWKDIDAIAVTQGPGLSGSLLIGVLTARTLAIIKNKPLYAINHVEAHVYASFLTESSLPGYDLPQKPPKFPLLAMIVSGGHTQLVLFQGHFQYEVLGKTADDAAGEAFDKVAKILGLPYPGGPSISKKAKQGNPGAIKLPEVKMADKYAFSFSGLKTAVLRATQAQTGHGYDFPSSKLPGLLNEAQKADIAASFQDRAVKILVEHLTKAAEEFKPSSIMLAGGVAANQELRRQVKEKLKLLLFCPDIKLCTDNAAMIATLGYFQASRRKSVANPYTLEPEPGLQM